ncbi:hypothetical protein MMC18_002854 [Xylographa bjoerkii]|nr:hypothetical protein [Xylographa bjoerkii]
MAPISTKKEEERSLLYSSHGISASRFNTDEIRRNPALTLETLERKQENEKKKESAPVQQKQTHPIKSSYSAEVSRISSDSKPQPNAARSGPPDAANVKSVDRSVLRNDVVMLPDNFELLGTTKPRCSDPLDELCKALRVPYTVLEVPSGPRQAQGPRTKHIYRRNELNHYLDDPTLQNFERATSEGYGEDYEVSIEEVGSDNRSQVQRLWDNYYYFILPLAALVACPLLFCLGTCCDFCCRGSIGKRAQRRAERAGRLTQEKEERRMKKARKAEAKQAREEAERTRSTGEDIELQNINQV